MDRRAFCRVLLVAPPLAALAGWRRPPRLELDPWQLELLARYTRAHYERAINPPITWDTQTRSWRPVV